MLSAQESDFTPFFLDMSPKENLSEIKPHLQKLFNLKFYGIHAILFLMTKYDAIQIFLT